jgi:cytochrome c-type biogenesis protein CcmH
MRTILLGMALAVGVAIALPAAAVEPAEKMADPALEARAESVGRELRCLVCQNESIEESAASLAHDIRVLLRERIKAGDNDRQATQYIVDRYGEFVLLKPRMEPATYVLWFGPPAILVLGGAVLLWRARSRGKLLPPAPLGAEERARLAALLKDGDS